MVLHSGINLANASTMFSSIVPLRKSFADPHFDNQPMYKLEKSGSK
jgi:hypothetical protein